ncbi:MAG: ABC transporter permease, partial [Chloroflexi bacterium]|nr:ABC transporter permease [Chloroflexota bacterium]
LQLSTVKTHHLLLGVGATQLVVAVFQIPVTFAAALLMGFQSNGSIWLGIGVGLLFSVSMIGLGLITTAFSRSDGEAANLGASLGVLLVLISGAMFPLPEATLFVVNGRSFAFTDLIPAAHAAEALRRVLVFGDGVQAIAYELMMLTLLSILLLLIGMGLYQKRRMVKVI